MFTSQLHRLFEDFGHFFDNASLQSHQHLGQMTSNIWSNDQELIVQVEIPGINPKELSAHVEQNVLHLSYESATTDDRNYIKGQSRAASIERQLQLPIEVDPASAKAEYKDGILQINFKRQQKDTHNIKIKVK